MSQNPVTDAWRPGGDKPVTPYYGEPQGEDAASGALSPLRLLHIMRKRWLSILLTLVFAGCAALYYLSKAPRLYESKAVIELIARRPRFLDKKAAVIEDPSANAQTEETMNTQLEKLRCKTMLAAVVDSYRLAHPDDPLPEPLLARRLRGGASFALIRKTRLVSIVFTDTDPAFAARACQAYAEGTEANARAENRAASDAAVAWLDTQTKSMQQELEKADQALFDARQSCQMDVLQGQRKTVSEALQSFNQSLVNIESDAARERELFAALNAVELTPENAGRLPAVVSRSPDIEQALARWQAAAAERDSLLTKYTADHPEVAARSAETSLFWEQARAAIGRARLTTGSNLELLCRQAESLGRLKEEQSTRASDLERDILDREMKLAALQRARDASDAACLGLLARIQDARLSADENTASVKVVENATLPGSPVSPRTTRIVLLALLLGTAGGLGLAFLTEALEDHVLDARDIEAATGLKILALVPHVRSRNRKDIATAALTRRHGELIEAFAGLRSVLDSPAYRARAKVILVASSMPEEGKTTACCNLAVTWARSGQNVLLIDFDLRRPRIAGIFPMPPGSPGLLDHLAGGESGLADLPYASGCPNLSVIANRPLANTDPAELVSGARVIELLNWARSSFDRIILDTPPLGIVSDSLILAGLADGVLIMARPGVSRKQAIRRTAARFRDVGVSALAAVMNDVDPARSLYHPYGAYYPRPGDNPNQEQTRGVH